MDLRVRVLVTGAASGFGRAVSAELRRRGDQVAALDVVPGPGIRVADVRDADAVLRATHDAIGDMGGLDVLINNAGIGAPAHTGQAPDQEALATIDVNLFGPWRVTAACLPALVASRGRVVNVASGLAAVNSPFAAAYCASKRALCAYSDVLRLEHGDRISVTTVYPGYVRTPIHQRSEELGYSLSGVVPEESMDAVVRCLVRACHAPKARRDMATSLPTAAGVFFARHFRRTTDAVTRHYMRRLKSRGHFSGSGVPLGAAERRD